MMRYKILILPAAALLLAGCAPTQGMIDLKEIEIKEKSKTDLAIINGYFGGKKKDTADSERAEREFFEERRIPVKAGIRSDREKLPLPEGDGSGPPCSVKCIDDCDDQCRIECPEMYKELCGESEVKYIPPSDDEFEWGETITEDRQPPPEIEEEKPRPEIEAEKPRPESIIAKANASGDNNNQTNIVGNNNKTLVQGGAGANNSTPNPIEQAMSRLLLREVPPLKSGGEIAAEQARGLLNDGVDGAVKLTPLAIGLGAVSAVKKGFDRAGDKNSNNPQYDLSDNSTETNIATAPTAEGVLEQ